MLGYVEAHIEQGPVLEKNNLAVGIVNTIAGQTRARVSFIGRAGHAGTTPMNLRKDALCAAAEFITATEKLAKKTSGLVATVGEISASPGAGNVIPGEVRLSLGYPPCEGFRPQIRSFRIEKNRVPDIAAQKDKIGW